MATNLRKFLLKKFPTNKYFDCPVSNEQQELMQEFCDQETKELKQQLEDAIILRQAALTDWDEMHNQLTEANALIEKMGKALEDFFNSDGNDISTQKERHETLFNQYKTTQEVKP